MTTTVIGTQWGGEGQGKIVDLISQDADYAIRYHGGNNAGNVVLIGDKKFYFHLIPTGIFRPKTKAVITNGVVVDLDVLTAEMKLVELAGISLKNKLFISPQCHLILPYHKAFDYLYKHAHGKDISPLVSRGICFAYADRLSYHGISLYDLLQWNDFVKKFTCQAEVKNKIIKTFGGRPIDVAEELARFKKLRKIIAPYVSDTYQIVRTAIAKKKILVFEGVHEVMTDTDWPIKHADAVIGVVKSYVSRMGDGPMPTEIFGKLADTLRENGHEYGITTGRPRRIGWLDLEPVTFSCYVNGVTKLAITKLDILSGLSEIKICTGYTIGGKKIPYSSCGYKELAQLKPVYKTFKGWKEDISNVRTWNELPKACRIYVKFIESFLGVPLTILSVGADRNAHIMM